MRYRALNPYNRRRNIIKLPPLLDKEKEAERQKSIKEVQEEFEQQGGKNKQRRYKRIYIK